MIQQWLHKKNKQNKKKPQGWKYYILTSLQNNIQYPDLWRVSLTDFKGKSHIFVLKSVSSISGFV